MAKDKKRGFFSWLGLGSQTQQSDGAEKNDAEQSTVLPETAENETNTAPHLQEQSDDGERLPVHHGLEDRQSSTASDISSAEHAAEAEAGVEPHVLNLEVEQHIHHVDERPAAKPEEHNASERVKPLTQLPSEQNDVFTSDEMQPHESIELVEALERQSVADVDSVQDPKETFETPLTAEDDGELQPHDAVELVETMEQPAADSLNEPVAMNRDETADGETEPAPVLEQERPTKEGFFARLKRSLLRTKQNLGSGFLSLFRNRKIDSDLFEELEEQLLIADVGVATTRKIIESLTQHVDRKKLNDAEALYGELKNDMSAILEKVSAPLDISSHKPFVILMVGVNGVGKTTTIGKLARQFQQQGKSVMLAAGDTFRAAAVEQLQVWGQRNNIPVIAQHTGADSASVIFDALQAANARNIDVLIADTAGRLQNKSHLMEELKKIVRVMQKIDPQAPHEVMLTIDASTGQNAVSQVKLFNEAVGLTGITLTKLDGTAKGGVIFAVADQFMIPIRYIGVGEGIEDLRPFKSDDFIEALFAREDQS
jgi:fused signal recognition particle receptor